MSGQTILAGQDKIACLQCAGRLGI